MSNVKSGSSTGRPAARVGRPPDPVFTPVTLDEADGKTLRLVHMPMRVRQMTPDLIVRMPAEALSDAVTEALGWTLQSLSGARRNYRTQQDRLIALSGRLHDSDAWCQRLMAEHMVSVTHEPDVVRTSTPRMAKSVGISLSGRSVTRDEAQRLAILAAVLITVRQIT